MAYTTTTGLITTTSSPTTPQMTFVWNAYLDTTGTILNVEVTYGPGTTQVTTSQAQIPWNSSSPVQLTTVAPDAAPTITGGVTAYWGDYDTVTNSPTSYLVTFSGGMFLADVINVASSDQSQAGNNQQIIVCASLNTPD